MKNAEYLVLNFGYLCFVVIKLKLFPYKLLNKPHPLLLSAQNIKHY